MQVYDNILDAIGNTPIVKLNRMVPENGPNVYVKLEYLNPAGSIKDRIARHIIRRAEEKGDLKPGGTIVENTSGNTGAGLAMVAAVRGYDAIFTIPDKMSSEKINFMKSFGARVVVTPTSVPAESPQSYYETAKRIARNTEGSFYVNQYHNPANPEAHYASTGPEIWEQMDGKIDYFVAGIGTGGTLSGTARFLKEKNPDIKIIAVDPEGSVFYDYFKHGKPGEPRVYKLEGIGEDMMVEAMDFSVVDDIIQVNDEQGFQTTRKMARLEGIFAGGSSGAAVWGALQVASKLPADKNVLVILPDTGFRYLSKVYNDQWMLDNGIALEQTRETLGDIIASKGEQPLLTAGSNMLIKDVIHLMRSNNVSQLPVIDDGQYIGMISESRILEYLLNDNTSSDNAISPLVDTHTPLFSSRTPVSAGLEHMKKGHSALMVSGDSGKLHIITKIDMLEFLE
ncbi:MAG TPA: cysteine synthase [Caldithrix abyssi]|uniref:cysteine synthase n=1 Tax=Caldithrix abyssi TaxID=187145 RepID=A0A7V5RPF5_CALAY|nr:cysteine synthase [Caldithrix abyssi]